MIWRATIGICVIATLAVFWLYGVVGLPATPQAARVIQPTDVAAGARRVLILGTSLTRGGTWVEALETELQRCAPGATVTRLARAGAASGWGETALRAHLETERYDLVVIEFTANDASLANGMPLLLSRNRHVRMIEMVRDSGADVILATMSPAWGQNAWERPGQARYAAMYRDLAAELGTGLIDTRTDWLALPPPTRAALVPDGLHPTEEAHRQITVPAFAGALRPHLCR